jgi:hypothetical protein
MSYAHLLPRPVQDQSTSCNGGCDGIDLKGLFSVLRDQTAVISQDEDAGMSTPVAPLLSSNSSVYYNASGHCHAPNSTELPTEHNS